MSGRSSTTWRSYIADSTAQPTRSMSISDSNPRRLRSSQRSSSLMKLAIAFVAVVVVATEVTASPLRSREAERDVTDGANVKAMEHRPRRGASRGYEFRAIADLVPKGMKHIDRQHLSTKLCNELEDDEDGPPTFLEWNRFDLISGSGRESSQSQPESSAPSFPEKPSGIVDDDGHDDWVRKGWRDPRQGGGSSLDLSDNGLREPINTIISGRSDPYILTDTGLRDYVRSIGFSFECLDLHIGNLQRADLGDGHGWQGEIFEYRSTQGFGAPGRWVGACWESWYGGNHFRVWKQNGSEANTGAWFLAVSTERNLRHHHTIASDGYNTGRDLLVEAAMKGGTFGDRLWKADVEWVDGMLPRGDDGINHGIAIDGMTAVLTVQRYLTVPPASIESSQNMSFSGSLSSLLSSTLNSLKQALLVPIGGI